MLKPHVLALTLTTVAAFSACGDRTVNEPAAKGASPSPVENAQPNNPTRPLEPTFDSLSQNIFQMKCVSCHSLGKSAHRVLLDRQSLLTSPLQLVIPGNADESGLVIAVERADDERMPPSSRGYAPLSDLEKLSIRQWIQSGAN